MVHILTASLIEPKKYKLARFNKLGRKLYLNGLDPKKIA